MDIQNKVTNWMQKHARPLEAARYAFLFLHGSKEKFINELVKYQTPTGGFAYGLEPDCLNPNPSPIQTWTAIHYLLDLDPLDTLSIARGIIRNLETTMGEDGFYPIKLKSNNDYPHAIWWHYKETQDKADYNPSVALWAYLYREVNNVSAKQHLIKAFDDFIAKQKTEMHELKCFVDAYEWLYEIRKDFRNFAKFEVSLKSTLIDILKTFSKESLKTYGPTPLAFCDKPQAKLYPLLKPYIDIQMQEIKREIEDNEMWDINFSWGQYEKEFEIARRYWRGIIALKYSRFLSNK